MVRLAVRVVLCGVVARWVVLLWLTLFVCGVVIYCGYCLRGRCASAVLCGLFMLFCWCGLFGFLAVVCCLDVDMVVVDAC